MLKPHTGNSLWQGRRVGRATINPFGRIGAVPRKGEGIRNGLGPGWSGPGDWWSPSSIVGELPDSDAGELQVGVATGENKTGENNPACFWATDIPPAAPRQENGASCSRSSPARIFDRTQVADYKPIVTSCHYAIRSTHIGGPTGGGLALDIKSLEPPKKPPKNDNSPHSGEIVAYPYNIAKPTATKKTPNIEKCGTVFKIHRGAIRACLQNSLSYVAAIATVEFRSLEMPKSVSFTSPWGGIFNVMPKSVSFTSSTGPHPRPPHTHSSSMPRRPETPELFHAHLGVDQYVFRFYIPMQHFFLAVEMRESETDIPGEAGQDVLGHPLHGRRELLFDVREAAAIHKLQRHVHRAGVLRHERRVPMWETCVITRK